MSTSRALRAAIDIGSNSLLLTVLAADGSLLHDETRVVGLGRGLGDRGTFLPDRKALAEQVLTDYVEIASRLGVAASDILAVATSGARRAADAQAWFLHLHRVLGLVIRTLSGEEEARLTWLGAHVDLDIAAGPRLVVDLGGGSTELVLGDSDTIAVCTSLELGSVRLTERFLCAGNVIVPDRYDPGDIDAMRRAIDVSVAAVPFIPRPLTVIGVAASVTTLTAAGMGLECYEREKIHGAVLDRGTLARISARLCSADSVSRRAIVALSPERADYLLAGALVLDRVLEAAGASQMIASDRGLRFGILSEAR